MSEAGRYAAFIWSAYGVTGLVCALLCAVAFLGHRAQRRALAALEARSGEAARRGTAGG